MKNKRMIPGIEPVNDFNALKVIFKVLWFPFFFLGKGLRAFFGWWVVSFGHAATNKLDMPEIFSHPTYKDVQGNIYHNSMTERKDPF
ncbi:MAG TPA: hypothetical protein PKY89_07670 [Deltaproteobacteria bacterium]|nr:hypothetical protein [Deltaproteobacteria bacterium]